LFLPLPLALIVVALLPLSFVLVVKAIPAPISVVAPLTISLVLSPGPLDGVVV